MEKDLDKANKKEIKNDNQPISEEHHQEDGKNITDKISENRNIGGLTDRDDAPGSGINISNPAEHTLGNP